MNKIGLILKNTREDLDLTQIDVMRLTRINNKTLSGYENGVAEPDLETFAKLLNLYGLSADAVLDIKVTGQSCKLSSEEMDLVSYFRRLCKDRKSDLLVALKALCDQAE